MRKIVAAGTLVVLGLGPLPAALADDSDIFERTVVDPNVVMLMDISGSMNGKIQGKEKIEIAKDALIELVSGIDTINWGIFTFDGTEGATMVAPVGTPTDEVVSAIEDIKAGGGTPLGKATEDISDYFLGDFYGCPANGPDPEDFGDFPDGDDDDDDDDDAGDDTIGNCPSPAIRECQQSFAVVTSDGQPSQDDYYTQVVDAANTLYTTDYSDLDGLQNVVAHMVGFDNDAGKDLMTQAAAAGGGTFYEANNADQLRAALLAAVSTPTEGTYSFSVPAIPASSYDGGDKVYAASFVPHVTRPFWNGSLKAYTKTVTGQIPVDGDGNPDDSALVWDAGAKLAARTAASRNIWTYASGAKQNFTTTNGTLTPALLGVTGNPTKEKVIQFVRGIDSFDQDADGNSTEARDWKLGDIFHSAPVVVYPPPLALTDTSYETFKTANASRTTIALVGSNGGMLHAFRASDGVELWAFIPPEVLDRLSLMTANLGEHAFYVDGTPVIADVKLGGSWKTIALFGMRRGGGGYHALDITDTTNPSYLWSFSDADIEESWSKPAITKIQMDDGSEKWVAFVGGGFDMANNNDDGAAVFAIDLATGTALWKYSNTSNTDDRKYMNFSIPASPTPVDVDGDGFPNYLYVGDVGGQLWKFSIGTPAKLTSGMINNWTGMRLFAADPIQPNPPPAGEYLPEDAMFASPTVAIDDDGIRWVVIGTGDRVNPLSSGSNKFYAIRDSLGMTNGTNLTEADLTEATTTADVNNGWLLRLDDSYEKVLDSAQVFDSVVYFATYTAEPGDGCSPGGEATLYAVKLENGHAAINWDDMSHLEETDGSEERGKGVGTGIPSGPQVTLENGTASVVVMTTDEDVTSDSFAAPAETNLRYWREVD